MQIASIAGNRRYALVLSVAFSVSLLLVRFIHTGTFQHVYLLWNLFLAWIPYHITLVMQGYDQHRWKLRLWLPVFLAWMAFLPNAPYIITDLYHLPEGAGRAPMWFDLILILSFAWNGLIFGFISIRQMQRMVLTRFPWVPAQPFIATVMLLCGWGVYIGRYLRWNSWDLLVSPLPLLRQTGAMIMFPWQYTHVWGFTICMGLFMHIIYTAKFGTRQ